MADLYKHLDLVKAFESLTLGGKIDLVIVKLA